MSRRGTRFAAVHAILRLALLFVSSVVTVACDESFEAERKLDPILVREVIPADSVLVEKGEPFTLSIRLNRPVALGELYVEIYPEPLTIPGAQLSSTAHTMYFEDVQLNPEAMIHKLLIDGEHVYEPSISTWWDGPTGVAFLRGTIRTEDPERIRNSDLLVFLLPIETEFAPGSPGTFDRATPISVTEPQWSAELQAFGYRHNSLPDGDPFFVVAVADTDKNGHYEPEFDWWGAYGVTPEQPFLFLEPVTSVAGIATEGSGIYDFRLKPPSTLW